MAMDCSTRASPCGLSHPLGPVPALPSYLHEYIFRLSPPPHLQHVLRNEFDHRLTPLLIFPHLLHRPSNTFSYPQSALEVRRILSRPAVTHAPWIPLSPKAIVSEGLYPSPCRPSPLSLSRTTGYVPALWGTGGALARPRRCYDA